MQVADLHPGGGGGVFAVQGPGDVLPGGDGDTADVAEDHPGIVIVHAVQGRDEVLQVQGGFGHPQQDQLEHAVVHVHPLGVQLHQAPQGGGVAHRAEDEVPVEGLAVGLHPAAVGPQGVQILDALQNVCKVTQGVLRLLGRGVGRLGKGPEGGHIGEIPSVMGPQIQGMGGALHHRPGRLLHGGGDPQAGGKVVGAAVGQIAHRRAVFQLHQARQRLVEGAVSAGAHHQVIVPAPLGGEAGGVPGGLGQHHPHQVPGPAEGGHGVKQRGGGLGLARPGIDNEQQGLIHEQSPLPSSPLIIVPILYRFSRQIASI